MKATKLEVGKTYRWGGHTFVFEQVMGPLGNGAWDAMENGEGYRFWPDNMPEEVEPPAPWIVRTEYRVPKVGGAVVSRHLVAIPGGAHSLPQGVVRPLRSHVSVRDQARAAGHPSVFDREANPDRPVLPLDVQVALSALDGLAQMVTRVAQKYGPNVPTAEWHRIRAQVGALTEARATVARWVDGDLTNAEGTVRP